MQQGSILPLGGIRQFLETFFNGNNWGRGVLLGCMWWMEVRDAAEYPTKHRIAPFKKKYLALKVSSDEMENHCPRVSSLISLPGELQLTYQDSAQMSSPLQSLPLPTSSSFPDKYCHIFLTFSYTSLF